MSSLLLQVSGADHLLTINDIVPGLLVNATLKEVITRKYDLLHMSCFQVTTNGLVFTIFGVFEARASIRHLPGDKYTTEGFIVKKKVNIGLR